MQSGLGPIAFAITANGTTYEELPKINFSQADLLQGRLVCETANTDAGDLLDVYLESRGRDGKWKERAHFGQLNGAMSPSASTPETREFSLSKLGPLSDSEEASESNESLGASSITENTVRNGPFPGLYRDKTNGQTLTGWRFKIVASGELDTDMSFAGNLYLEWDAMP